jgi:hypothetical protein
MTTAPERRAQKRCGHRLNPSRQSRVVTVSERTVRADARDSQCHDRCRQIRDCEVPGSGIPRAHRERRQSD